MKSLKHVTWHTKCSDKQHAICLLSHDFWSGRLLAFFFCHALHFFVTPHSSFSINVSCISKLLNTHILIWTSFAVHGLVSLSTEAQWHRNHLHPLTAPHLSCSALMNPFSLLDVCLFYFWVKQESTVLNTGANIIHFTIKFCTLTL